MNSGGRLQPDDARQRVLQPCAGMTRTNREVETMLFGIESPAQMVSPPSNSPTAKVPDRQLTVCTFGQSISACLRSLMAAAPPSYLPMTRSDNFGGGAGSIPAAGRSE